MTKEFENIQKNVLSGRSENERQYNILVQQEKEREEEKKRIWEQEKKNKEMVRIKNKKIFEDAKVVTLFEEIRDSRLVVWSTEPVYEYKDGQKIKVSDYQPAKIEWSVDNSAIYLEYNYSFRRCYGIDDEGNPNGNYSYDTIKLDLLSNGKIGEIDLIDDCKRRKYSDKTTYIRKEKEIKDISGYITTKLLER